MGTDNMEKLFLEKKRAATPAFNILEGESNIGEIAPLGNIETREESNTGEIAPVGRIETRKLEEDTSLKTKAEAVIVSDNIIGEKAGKPSLSSKSRKQVKVGAKTPRLKKSFKAKKLKWAQKLATSPVKNRVHAMLKTATVREGVFF